MILRSLRELFLRRISFSLPMLETRVRESPGLVDRGKKFSAAQLGYFSQAQNSTEHHQLRHSAGDRHGDVSCILAVSGRPEAYSGEIMNMDARDSVHALPCVHHPHPRGSSRHRIAGYRRNLASRSPFYSDSVRRRGYSLLPQQYHVLCRGALRQVAPAFFASIAKWGCLALFLLIGMNFGMTGIVWSLSVSYINIFLINAALPGEICGQSRP